MHDVMHIRSTYAQHPLQRSTGERVVIVGTGKQAIIAFEHFTYDSPHEIVAFSAEKGFLKSDVCCGRPVVELDALTSAYPPSAYRAFVAVSGTQLNRLRRRLYQAVKAAGYTCVSYVSSNASVWHNVEIGENTSVFEHNSLQHMVRVGNNVILWNGVHVGHQSVIEDDCFLASHVVIAGSCRVGRGSFLGINSCLANNVYLAEDCVLGAGAMVVEETEPRNIYAGNPARAVGTDSFEEFGVS
jgi:sugar O-acyltransferase (sialic acid O-acetyltransferase NeuD family)